MSSTAGIATAAGGILTANAENQSGIANGRVADWNAHVADVQSKDAMARGEAGVANIEQQSKLLIGSQRASFAAQGIQVDTGTAAIVTADTQTMSDRDVSTTRLNAAREAWGFQVQATDYRMRGDIARQTGRQEALGTLLTTGAKSADIYNRNHPGTTVPAKSSSAGPF